jgi:predicted secreted Zn-dependent protease
VNRNYYMVDLNDPMTLTRAMWDQGMSARSGVVGSASQRYRWSFEAAPVREGGCVIRALRATGEIVITLPRWSAPSGSSSARRLWWQLYLNNITAHENTHVHIFEDHLREMLRVVEGIVAADCAAARASAREALQRGADEMNRRQVEFDRSDASVSVTLPPP